MSEAQHLWTVYLLRCADDSLYCGITTDLKRRINEHNAGTGAKYTRSRTPVKLAASATFADRSTASQVEYAVKKRPAANKIEFLQHQFQEFGIPPRPTED